MSGSWVLTITIIVLGIAFVLACYAMPQLFVKVDNRTTAKDKAEVEDASCMVVTR